MYTMQNPLTVAAVLAFVVRVASASSRLLRKITHEVAAVVARETGVDARDWQIDFGPVEGKAGEVKHIEKVMQIAFRGEKVMAIDTCTPTGLGTRVRNIVVGVKMQTPLSNGGGVLTAFFANNALGNGIKWDVCEIGQNISMDVEFIQDGVFDCTVFGKAYPEKRFVA